MNVIRQFCPRTLSIPLELAGGVRYHGFLSKSDPKDVEKLRELFRTCSLFVLPSLYEPFGIAPLEANAVLEMRAAGGNGIAKRIQAWPMKTIW